MIERQGWKLVLKGFQRRGDFPPPKSRRSETQTYRRIYKILKLCEDVKQRKQIAIEANAQVEYSFNSSDLGLSEGCLRLAVKCSTGQRIFDLF